MPVALHAGDREDLAALDLAGHVIELGNAVRPQQGYVVEDEAPAARARRLLVDAHEHFAAHHLGGQGGLGVGRRRLAHNLSTSNHRDLVGDRAHFAQLVGDEHDRRPRIGELTHDRHQLIRLLRGQHGRRLIQDENLRLTRQRLDDLDALLRTNRQILDQRIGIQVESESR